jgi:hypothetical protein
MLTPFAGVGVSAGASIGYGKNNHLTGGVTTLTSNFAVTLSTPIGLVAFIHF